MICDYYECYLRHTSDSPSQRVRPISSFIVAPLISDFKRKERIQRLKKVRAVGRCKEISVGRCELPSRKKAPLFSPRASLLFGRGDICWNNIDIRSFARLFSSLSVNKILLSVSKIIDKSPKHAN